MPIFLFNGTKHPNKEGSIGYFLTIKEETPILS